MMRTLRGLLAVGVAGSVLFGASVPAAAAPFPQSPTHPDYSELWANPVVRVGEKDAEETLAAELVEVTPFTSDGSVSATVRLTNRSSEPITQASITARRAGAVATVAEARRALAQDVGAYTTVGETTALEDLAPGESTEVTLTYEADNPLSLNFTGTYPLLFAISGQAITDEGARLISTSERTLIRVEAGASAADTAADEAPPIPEVSLLLPLTARTYVTPGETGEAPENPPLLLQNESFSEQLSPGGRLLELLDVYADALTGPAAAGTCLAVDPAIVYTASRMVDGYQVAGERGVVDTQPRRLRDSWTTENTAPDTSDGTGADAAATFLETLRRLAADHCVTALPWANADLGAVARTNNAWLMRETLERGQGTLATILGIRPRTNLVIPGSGYLEPGTERAMAWADATTTTVFETGGLAAAWEAATQEDRGALTTAAAPGEPIPAQQPVGVLVAGNTVQADTPIADLGANIHAVTFDASLAATLAATGAQPRTTAYSNPAFRYDYRVDSETARATTAANSLHLALSTAAQDEERLLIMPPADVDASTARLIVDTLAGEDVAYVPATAAEVSPGTNTGTPFTDPAAYGDTEVQPLAQQAFIADDISRLLINDPGIALTRYGYTAPLRRDMITALSATGRSTIAGFDTSVEATRQRTTVLRDTLRGIVSSVALLPPGNVFTRTSDNSPLLIAVRNGLPLPAHTSIKYTSDDGMVISTPDSVIIPARGSLTIQMTADTPDGENASTADLWLATTDGARISDPITISVRTRTDAIRIGVVAASIIAAAGLALIYGIGKRRR
ncbi:hypothetical membrane protein [Corynebacterium renale]|uniref:hypothetical protein n=1 Tax=Corynebacterium renale TaxID=1724 RepID=UPI000DA37DE1|nr:hypothetical protein [Corynebacterium renale]SQG63632.1 hypothetical membrane protein [Corynebacterium renale]STD01258.1 hypothetical membrane protein [Corynebacterium renale]